MLPSTCFTTFRFAFKFMIHFELIFAYDDMNYRLRLVFGLDIPTVLAFWFCVLLAAFDFY